MLFAAGTFSISSGVNFDAIGLWFKRKLGFVLTSDHHLPVLKTCAFGVGIQDANLPTLQLVYAGHCSILALHTHSRQMTRP